MAHAERQIDTPVQEKSVAQLPRCPLFCLLNWHRALISRQSVETMNSFDLCWRTDHDALQMAPGGGATSNVEGLEVRHGRRKLGHFLSKGEFVHASK